MASKNGRGKRYSKVAQMCGDCQDFPEIIQFLRNAQMLRAAQDGHVECLRAAIAVGANVNVRDVNNPPRKTALMYAIEKQHWDCIKLLVESGAYVNILNDYGQTPLMKAALQGPENMVKLFVKSEADVNKTDALGRTPLMVAAEKGHDYLVDVLVKAGADVNVQQHIVNISITNEIQPMIGCTALMYAAKSGNTQCLEILLKSGANVNTKQEENAYTALTYAGIRGEKHMVDRLLKGRSDLSGLFEALLDVIDEGNDERCKYLISLGTDVNMRGGRALMYATHDGHLQCLKELIKGGADVKANEENALICAAREGHVKCLMELIKAGADVNALCYGESALMWASRKGHVKCLMELIEAGADVIQGKALAAAAENGQEKCLIELLKAGAGVNINDYYTCSSIINAARGGHISCVKILIEAGAHVNTCQLGRLNLKALHTLLAAGMKINQPTRLGPNALTRMIQRENVEVIYSWSISEEEQIIGILHAAGESVDTTVLENPDCRRKIFLKFPDFLNFCVNINLKSICRETIRKHLLQMSQVNLFYRVPRLGLPAALRKYLLYNVSINNDILL